MPRTNKVDWKAWNEERKRFAKRGTQGFTADLEALEQHIKTLREICPKDKAGYPHNTALMVLNEEQQTLDKVRKWAVQIGG